MEGDKNSANYTNVHSCSHVITRHPLHYIRTPRRTVKILLKALFKSLTHTITTDFNLLVVQNMTRDNISEEKHLSDTQHYNIETFFIELPICTIKSSYRPCQIFTAYLKKDTQDEFIVFLLLCENIYHVN